MRRLVLALLTTAILLGIAPAAAQASPVRVTLLRERDMLTLVVQASDSASLLDFRFQYLDEYDREILIALRDYDQFRESSADVTEACFVLRAFETETPVPQDCLNITRTNLHVQELGTASLFWFDGVINLQRPLTILDVNGFVGVCPAENPRCEFDYPHAPPGEPPPPPILFDAADLDNREILVLIAEFERLNPEINPLQPQGEWERILENAISEVGVNARAELLPQTFRSHDEARAAAEQYGATLVIWGYVGAAVVNSQYTVTPRWSQLDTQPGETEVIGTLDELALFVSPGGDVEYVFNFVTAQLVYFSREDYQAALDLMDRAITLVPAGREIEMGVGALYFYRGYTQVYLGAPPETVIEDFTHAIDFGLAGANAYTNRGAAYNELGEYERAIVDFNQAITLDPDNASAYSNRGNSYYHLGETDQAIADYDRAIALNPALADAYFNRGITYAELGEYAQAVADFDQTIALSPDFADAYNNRGNAYSSLGEVEQAFADYEQAIALDPESVLAYHNRGNVYYDTGNLRAAYQDFTRAVEIDPTFAAAYVGLLSVDVDRGRCDQAADALRTYIELMGNAADPAVEGYYRQRCIG